MPRGEGDERKVIERGGEGRRGRGRESKLGWNWCITFARLGRSSTVRAKFYKIHTTINQ